MLSPWITSIFNICIATYLPAVLMFKLFIQSFDNPTKVLLTDFLELPWSMWCAGLSIFSCFGTYYTGRYLLGLEDSPTTEFWYYAFIISKVPELLDTFFIVARSKHLQVLQWYHHWATMTICFAASSLACKSFTVFFFMNYVAHSFMYAYYAIYPYYGKFLKYYAGFITFIQIAQMAAAILLAIQIFYYDDFSSCLYIPSPSEIWRIFSIGIAMYLSYFILFLRIYFERSARLATSKD